ncbi:MAG: hypothetical protein OJF49_001374 [Ktedonobacterales bacterium]|jgi:outer membrane protein assembly factor BamB|nr:MAG: hypothetical protein OJF49_001374 [Ktedonobacterales bacterium]
MRRRFPRIAVLCLLLAALLPIGLFAGVRLTQAASPKIHLEPCCDPTSGTPASNFRIKGTYFGATEQVTITFDSAQIGIATTDSTGVFKTKLKVPATAQPGKHTVTAHGQTSGLSASATFLVRTTWEGFGYLPFGGRYNSFENTIAPGNVANLTLDWSYAAGSAVVSSPAEVHNVIYAASQSGTLFALADATGASAWSYPIGSAVASSPEVEDQVIYIGADDGKLYAISTAGAFLWSGATGGAIRSAPVDAEGLSGSVDAMIIAGSNDGSLYAFNADGCGAGVTSCSPLWTGATGGAINSSPSYNRGVVYVGSDDGKLYAFNVYGCGAATCAPLWTGATGGAITSYPAVVNGVVYVSSSDGKLYAFNSAGCGSATCSPLWAGVTSGTNLSSPAFAKGAVYVGASDGKLYAFSAAGCGAATCAPLWTGATGGAIASSPAIANGLVYVGSDDGKLYAFKVGCASGGASCAPLWTGVTGGAITSSPAVANGVVNVGSDDGKLYAFHLPGATP